MIWMAFFSSDTDFVLEQTINAVKLQEISPLLVEAADADKVDILAQGCLKVYSLGSLP
jgi:hypothetical protein